VHLRLTAVASGLQSPVAIAWRQNDSKMYVAEQGGDVVAVANGAIAPAKVLTVAVSHANEQGLLGLAFSPDGTKLYVDYTDPVGDTRVVEYTMRGDVADAASARQILFQKQPFSNHNGGQVLIGPDGMLYITLGDGGSEGDPSGNGQKLSTLLAKILRIDPQATATAPYSVPADNPFVDRAGARTETWMYGLRNPWRFSFDRATNDVWIGDVGQNLFEEIDYAPAGSKGINWGWSAREGLHAYDGGNNSAPGARDPIVEVPHSNGSCAIVGGYVYRGRAIPSMRGVYIYGDNCRPQLAGIVQQDGRAVQHADLGPQVSALTTFGEDSSGELYAVSRDGMVFELTNG
jgi:glucose/arabinose dehydrogenase